MHGDNIANRAEDFFAAGSVRQSHAIARSLAEQLRRCLIHLEHVAFAVGHDNGLKDRLQHGVGELKLHLPPSSFGVAQFAQPDRNAVQFAGEDAKAVAAAPVDAMLQIALGDAMRIARQALNRPQDEDNRDRGDKDGGQAERAGERELPGSPQRAARGKDQARRKAAEEHTAENQSLGKVEHVRYPRR